MKKLLLPALALWLAACAPPPAPDTRAADEAAIRETDEAWSKAAEARNLDAVVSYYTADAQLLAPNAPIAIGTPAIRAGWAPLMDPAVALSWKVSKVEVARSGDLGFVVGTYTMAMKPVNDTGKMVEVWKKQADGKWKCVADIFNSDLPPTPPAPAPKKK